MKAQASIENLMVFTALLAVISLIIPASAYFFDAGIFSLTVLQAKTFADKIQLTTEEISFLGQGSIKQIKFNPISRTEIFIEDNFLQITVFYKNKSKSIERELCCSLPFVDEVIENETILWIKKEPELSLVIE